MTRIIAGSAGGSRLLAPAGRETRPTSDRVREALFSRLEHDGLLDATRVLDLYAGSGALGLEALSRGARSAVLVEQGQAAARTIRRNLDSTGLREGVVVADRVERVLTRPVPGAPFDLVLADPPYALSQESLTEVLRLLVAGRWLATHAAVVVERSARTPEPAWPPSLEPYDDRRYGETRIWFAEPV
jgi:16S rRNA (guanine966-N2)-methyltransferase